MRIFITGATGFIGSYVAYRLLAGGHELVALARNPNKTPSLSVHERVRRVQGTLYDSDVIREALEGCEACVHLALGWGDTALSMLKTDTTATVTLLESCASAGVKHFIYTSSTAAIGNFWPHMVEADASRPSNNYGATKAASEAFVLAMGEQTGMRCNVIRPGYTFGNPVVEGAPTQPDQRFHQICNQAVRGQEIHVRAGDGTQFVWAGDLARLYEAVLGSTRSREVYFGLAKPFVSWQDIAQQAVALARSESRIVVEGEPAPRCMFDLSKIAKHFGLEFGSTDKLNEHIRYLLGAATQALGR